MKGQGRKSALPQCNCWTDALLRQTLINKKGNIILLSFAWNLKMTIETVCLRSSQVSLQLVFNWSLVFQPFLLKCSFCLLRVNPKSLFSSVSTNVLQISVCNKSATTLVHHQVRSPFSKSKVILQFACICHQHWVLKVFQWFLWAKNMINSNKK